jgi:hypothetical protein
MTSNEPYAFFRQVIESDLPYIAQCLGAGAGLPYAAWGAILQSLRLQFYDAEDGWKPYAWVMVIEGRPVFLLESIDDQLFFTGPPSWADHSRRMMLAWQAALIYFFLRLGRDVVNVAVQAHRATEVKALQRLGCRKTGAFTDRSGTYFRLSCRREEFCPVI